MNRKSWLITAIGLGLSYLAVNVAWLVCDTRPPQWDDAWYLTESLRLFDTSQERGWTAYLVQFNNTFGFKAPLIVALPTPFYLLFGRD